MTPALEMLIRYRSVLSAWATSLVEKRTLNHEKRVNSMHTSVILETDKFPEGVFREVLASASSYERS